MSRDEAVLRARLAALQRCVPVVDWRVAVRRRTSLLTVAMDDNLMRERMALLEDVFLSRGSLLSGLRNYPLLALKSESVAARVAELQSLFGGASELDAKRIVTNCQGMLLTRSVVSTRARVDVMVDALGFSLSNVKQMAIRSANFLRLSPETIQENVRMFLHIEPPPRGMEVLIRHPALICRRHAYNRLAYHKLQLTRKAASSEGSGAASTTENGGATAKRGRGRPRTPLSEISVAVMQKAKFEKLFPEYKEKVDYVPQLSRAREKRDVL